MQGISGIAAPAKGARQIAGVAWRGLIQVVAGPDPAAGRRWRSPGQRWAARTGLGIATLLLCTASLASLSDGYGLLILDFRARHVPNGSGFHYAPPATAVVPSPVSMVQVLVQVLVALAVVAPLLMAVRYPLLGWRIGWLGLLLVPLLHERWWGGLPWDPVQILVLLTVLCLAGIRHERPVLCWLWALTLIPWWLWAGKNGPSLVIGRAGQPGVRSPWRSRWTGWVPSGGPGRPWPTRLTRPNWSGHGWPCSNNAPGSRGNCTTWSPTTCRSWPSGPKAHRTGWGHCRNRCAPSSDR